jgi:hypothetical protein
MRTLSGIASAAAISFACLAATAAPSGVPLFSSDEPLTLRLTAPFDDLFANARTNAEYSVAGSVSYGSGGGRPATIDGVTITLRGHTSRRESECAFPKLKLKFATPPADGPFAGVAAVKIGTHCGDSTTDSLTARFGRLPNERSPLREAFVYRLLDVVGIPTLKARTARITYVTGDPGAGEAVQGAQTVTRHAMLLEDDDLAKTRFGAEQEFDEQTFTTAADQLTPEDTARLAFAEALIGNFDWCLKFYAKDTYRCDARHALWNVLAYRTGERTVPVIYDFDVSGMVAGHHAWFRDVYNEAFSASKSQAEVEVVSQLQRTRSLFPRDLLDKTRAYFTSKKADAYRALDRSRLDADTARPIRQYMDVFFAAIGSDDVFYRPVVVAKDTVAYKDAGRTGPACPTATTVPIGTPVGEPTDMNGEMVQVVLLDALWRWAPPVKCPQMQRGAVWLDRSAIGKDYPK